ncbi:hypothetical protein GW17_00052890 [Ensete ventricosum]|nr:hypothetical protein GW17_00052890 [Ensete ventricosum]
MYVHKPKDTDKHEHFIKHLVYILTVTVAISTSHHSLNPNLTCESRLRRRHFSLLSLSLPLSAAIATVASCR